MQIAARSFHLVKSYGYSYYFSFYQLPTNIRVGLEVTSEIAVEMERLIKNIETTKETVNKNKFREKKRQSAERKRKAIEVPFQRQVLCKLNMIFCDQSFALVSTHHKDLF